MGFRCTRKSVEFPQPIGRQRIAVCREKKGGPSLIPLKHLRDRVLSYLHVLPAGIRTVFRNNASLRSAVIFRSDREARTFLRPSEVLLIPLKTAIALLAHLRIGTVARSHLKLALSRIDSRPRRRKAHRRLQHNGSVKNVPARRRRCVGSGVMGPACVCVARAWTT